jgi:nucleoside-diphosphate-sugar epimerase
MVSSILCWCRVTFVPVIRNSYHRGPLSEARRDNVIGTESVLKCARAAGVKRFVHCSTGTVICIPALCHAFF